MDQAVRDRLVKIFDEPKSTPEDWERHNTALKEYWDNHPSEDEFAEDMEEVWITTRGFYYFINHPFVPPQVRELKIGQVIVDETGRKHKVSHFFHGRPVFISDL